MRRSQPCLVLAFMTENHGSRGFMTFMTPGAQMLGLVLMGVIYALLVPVLIRWIDSGALITVVCVLLFVPIGSVTAALADVLTGLLDDGAPPGTGDAEDSARPDDELIIKTLEETGGKEAVESLREIFKHASDAEPVNDNGTLYGIN